MPGRTSNSSMLGGLNIDRSVQAHAQDETEYGPERLPPGITNGVAQLTKCYFDKYRSGRDTGKPYFYAQGSVIEPESVLDPRTNREVKVRGKFTELRIAVFDTQTQAGKVTTEDEHVATIMNEMRKLANDDNFTATAQTGEDLENLAALLQETAPFFKFRTSPRLDQQTGQITGAWENWDGGKGLEDYAPPSEDEGTRDNSPVASASRGPAGRAQAPTRQSSAPAPRATSAPAARGPAPAPRAQAPTGRGPAPTTRANAPAGRANGAMATQTRPAPAGRGRAPAPAQEPAQEFDEFGDIDSLVKQANNTRKAAESDAAIDKLFELAAQVGIEEEEAKKTGSWQELGDLILSTREGGGASSEETQNGDEGEGEGSQQYDEPQAEYEPSKGDNGYFRPKDARTGKVAVQPVEVEVIAVYKGSRKVDLRNLDTKVIYKGVLWDDLLQSADVEGQ